MSHTTPLNTSPGINQDIVIRKARAATLAFRHFADEAHTIHYPLTDSFRLIIKPFAEAPDADAYVNVTSADTLVIDDHEIRYALSAEESNIDRARVWYEVIDITTNQNWWQGYMPIRVGKAGEESATEVSGTINLGDTVVEGVIALSANDGELDGGSASSVYLAEQVIDGGDA